MGQKVYEFESVIYAVKEKGGAYVVFPYDIRKEFGRGRVRVHATFDGEPYDGSIVNMGVKNPDGTICYVLGLRKDIRERIGKQPGDTVFVTVSEQKQAGGMDMEEKRLEAFEKMLAAVQSEYRDILSKMERMKAEGKVKTVTYRQMTSRRAMYQDMLSLYQIYGLTE